MPISPRPTTAEIGPTPPSSKFRGAIHLIQSQVRVELNSSAFPPDIEIDTSFDRAEILAAHEPIPMAIPALLGLRKVLAKRRIEKANQQLPKLERERQVAQFVGKAILLNQGYSYRYNEDGSPNLLRPVTRRELKIARKLDEINSARRNAAAYQYGLTRPYRENVLRDFTATEHTKDVSSIDKLDRSTQKEADHITKSQKNYEQASNAISQFDKDYRSIIGKPSGEAKQAVRKRARAVVKVKSIEKRQEANRIARQALKAKAASKARAGWTGTKAVTKTVGRKTHSGVVIASTGTKRVVKKAPGKVKQAAGAGISKLRRK